MGRIDVFLSVHPLKGKESVDAKVCRCILHGRPSACINVEVMVSVAWACTLIQLHIVLAVLCTQAIIESAVCVLNDRVDGIEFCCQRFS